jgi:His/Glu/Gln/Arg/opine family amino acid ABC transporter permease subunit
MTWDWQVFLQDTGAGETYLDWMLSAWGWTMSVSLLALAVALVVGSLMGILRTVPSRALVFVGNAWTELFRNIPLLVQIFLWYHVIPQIWRPLQAVPSFALVVVALGFFTSARISEQVKAGIQSLPRGQRRRADDVRDAGAGGNLARRRGLPRRHGAVFRLGLRDQPRDAVRRAARAGAGDDRSGEVSAPGRSQALAPEHAVRRVVQ